MQAVFTLESFIGQCFITKDVTQKWVADHSDLVAEMCSLSVSEWVQIVSGAHRSEVGDGVAADPRYIFYFLNRGVTMNGG